MDVTYSEYQSLLCTGADIYYDYLTKEFELGHIESGRNVLTVRHVAKSEMPAEYIFQVDGKVKNADACQIGIKGVLYSSLRIIAVHRISKHSDSIRIHDEQNILASCQNLRPEDIRIISDLRFLIQKLRDFYKNNTFDFFPKPPVNLPPLSSCYTDGLSAEQCDAVNTVFSSPVSYINGAPGTGKTAYVLSRCILRYILNNKRVFLLAPTNNAIEQVLRGVLPILEQAGIDLRTVYRLGSSSEDFASEYPQVIGDLDKEQLFKNLQSRQTYYSDLLNQAISLQAECQENTAVLETCQATHIEICKLFLELQNKSAALENAKKAFLSAQEALQIKSNLCSDTMENELTAKDILHSCEQSILSIQQQLKQIKYAFWMKAKKERLSENLALLIGALPSHRDSLSTAQQEHSLAQDDYKNAQTHYNFCDARYRKISGEVCELKLHIRELSQCHALYSGEVERLLSENIFDLSPLWSVINALESEHAQFVEKCKEFPVDLYRCELDTIQKQIATIGNSSKFVQKRNALVLAGTIDSSLADLAIACDPDKNDDPKYPTYQPVYHVFLDEAGYTSLARGMTAFSTHAPVTFLGDHNQLSPVCEMNRISIDQFPVCLWAISVSYYSELITFDVPYLFHNCYKNMDSPRFDRLSYASLNTSYRFGNTLAEILAEHIYTPQFKGAANSTFEIFCINAPRETNHKKRESLSECHAIEAYLANNPESDFAILAPYQAQISQLRKNTHYRDHILTVHRSQGQEWDTVIFSVTDTSDMFFTNSRLPVGRKIINTAVSRAKRRLIIVCDQAFWDSCSNQLITKLLDAGKSIRVSESEKKEAML